MELQLTIAVGVRTDFLRTRAVCRGLALVRTVIRPSTAIGWLVILRAGRIAWVENWTLDIVIRVGVHAITRLCRRVQL